jgi:hypothetical protein
MTNSSEMRDLARRLLTCEADAGETFASTEGAILRVYEKLRLSLDALAGAAAFHSLASRALVLARSETPALRKAQVAANGSLQGLGDSEPYIVADKDRAGEYPAGDGGIVLIACLLGLLFTFLGAALTFSLLRNAWPGADFDERNSGNGRNT